MRSRAVILALLIGMAAAGAHAESLAFGAGASLPPGTVLDDDPLQAPREIFSSETQGGAQSFLVALGNLAFDSPFILGPSAARAGISCGTCHPAGHANARLVIPGLSPRPGVVDVSSSLFNPKADDRALDPIRIPSLRGVKSLAPYGHDGRIASLREFARNVIVNEFAGPEPSPLLLDALVAYMDEISFLPNTRLTPEGALAPGASAAERRGEALFRKAFAELGGRSCASCHIPDAAFTDGRRHDVGSGGLFKTPTLLNADFAVAYFHDGRYADYGAVVAHFDRIYGLALSPSEQRDLVAYLAAIGGADQPIEPVTVDFVLDEIGTFASTLDMLVQDRDLTTLSLAVDTLNREMRELRERFPGRELVDARAAIADLVLTLRAMTLDAERGNQAAASRTLAAFERGLLALRPRLEAVASRSLFDPARLARWRRQLAELRAAQN